MAKNKFEHNSSGIRCIKPEIAHSVTLQTVFCTALVMFETPQEENQLSDESLTDSSAGAVASGSVFSLVDVPSFPASSSSGFSAIYINYDISIFFAQLDIL